MMMMMPRSWGRKCGGFVKVVDFVRRSARVAIHFWRGSGIIGGIE